MTPPIGSWWYSASHNHNDGDFELPNSPLGGLVIRTGFATDDGEPAVRVVEVWRGDVLYHTLAEDDLVPGLDGGTVRRDIADQTARYVGQSIGRKGTKAAEHIEALTVLGMVLSGAVR